MTSLTQPMPKASYTTLIAALDKRLLKARTNWLGARDSGEKRKCQKVIDDLLTDRLVLTKMRDKDKVSGD